MEPAPSILTEVSPAPSVGRDAGGDAAASCPLARPSGPCGATQRSCNYNCESCFCSGGTWSCAAPGCAASPARVTLRVVDDGSSLPVRGPTFTEGGMKLPFQCDAPLANDAGAAGDAAADAGPACSSYSWESPPAGAHVIFVAAPGFTAKSIAVTVTISSGGCCGPSGSQTSDEVRLKL